MSNKTFDYGDLRITLTSAYTFVWDDRGSRSKRDVCVWAPAAQGDLCPLGDYADPSEWYEITGRRASLLVGQNPNTNPSKSAVARPADYSLIWQDTGSGAKQDGAFWRPIAPPGYVALGDVATSGYAKPSPQKIWCVREDLVGYGKFLATSSWDDIGSGAKSDVSIWAVEVESVGIDGAANLPIKADAFRAQPNYSRPSGEAARVLLLPIGKAFEKFEVVVPKVEATSLPEKGQQYSNQEQCKVTLPFNCFFDATHQPSLDNIRNPFLTLSRSIAWYTEGVWANRTSSEFGREQKIKYGISKTESESMTHTTGVEISSSYGVGLASGSVSLNYQFTYNTSSSFTEYSEREVTESFKVPAYTATVLFTKHVWIKCSRLESSYVLHQMEITANDDLYFSGCDLPK